MKKLRLELDSLAVDSFPTSERKEERGTVRAHTDIYTGCCSFDTCIFQCDTMYCPEPPNTYLCTLKKETCAPAYCSTFPRTHWCSDICSQGDCTFGCSDICP